MANANILLTSEPEGGTTEPKLAKGSRWTLLVAWFRRSMESTTARRKRIQATLEDKTRARWQAIGNWFKELWIVVRWKKRLPGWRSNVAVAILLTILTLILNVVFLIYATKKSLRRPNGLGTLAEGSCGAIDGWNKAAHAFINFMSSLLIAQSNTCMQLLASPTRHDVDIAHRDRKWVNIGMPSFRNIWNRHISIQRTVCLILLAISSAPLHLLWNSVIIFSPIAYQYNQLTVTDGFARGLPYMHDDSKLVLLDESDEGQGAHWPDNPYFLQQDLHTYEKLSVQECKREYAQDFVKGRADVIVVVHRKQPDVNESMILGSEAAGWGPWPYKWLCPGELSRTFDCRQSLFQPDGDWDFPKYNNPKVDHCLSKRMPERCKLEYGFWSTLFTVMANFIKLACFSATYWMLARAERKRLELQGNKKQKSMLLVTACDAIASFLEVPDVTTQGMSIVEIEDFYNGIWAHRWVSIKPMEWRERKARASFRAIGVRRWLINTTILLCIVVVPGLFLLIDLRFRKSSLRMTLSSINLLGMGRPNSQFLFGGWSDDPRNLNPDGSIPPRTQPSEWDIFGYIVLANTPHFFLATANYIWNKHLIVMLAAREYDKYAAPVKENDSDEQLLPKHGLRVTLPKEGTDQRGEHFFSMQKRYFGSNMLFWGPLHWLTSQAIFFARVEMLDHWLEVAPSSIHHVGYSILGIILFFTFATIGFGVSLWISCRKSDNRMPLAATCSGALSAACHPHDATLKHHEKKVHWGVEYGANRPVTEEERCTFTSLEAHYPETDHIYA